MKVFFLSDLHLRDGSSPPAQRFIAFLASEPKRGDILILGGDIFDLLIGNKAVFRVRFRPILDAIVAAASIGVQVYYLEGNHDFHFSSLFRGQTNILVRTEDFSVMLPNGVQVWVAHGDLVDEDDTGYLLLRAATKNAPFRVFVAVMPGSVVDWIGNRSSHASRKYTSERVENEGTDRLRRLYLDFARGKVSEGYRHVLVGHSHLRDQVEIAENGHVGEYLNLGFSADRLTLAVLESGSRFFKILERT